MNIDIYFKTFSFQNQRLIYKIIPFTKLTNSHNSNNTIIHRPLDHILPFTVYLTGNSFVYTRNVGVSNARKREQRLPTRDNLGLGCQGQHKSERDKFSRSKRERKGRQIRTAGPKTRERARKHTYLLRNFQNFRFRFCIFRNAVVFGFFESASALHRKFDPRRMAT